MAQSLARGVGPDAVHERVAGAEAGAGQRRPAADAGFDDTPRDEMRKQLLAEVNRSLAERVVPGAAEAVRSDEAAAA